MRARERVGEREAGREGRETLRLRHFGQLDFLGKGWWVGKEGNIKVPLDSQDSKINFITSAAPERGES